MSSAGTTGWQTFRPSIVARPSNCKLTGSDEACAGAVSVTWTWSFSAGTEAPLSVKPDSDVMKLAEKFYAELTAAVVDVILDDRDERPGFKFKDSELVGFPIRIGIGEKSLAKGEVEIKPRAGALLPTKAEEAVEKVLALVKRDA